MKTIYMTGKKGYTDGLYRLLDNKYPQYYNWENDKWEDSDDYDIFFYRNCIYINEDEANKYAKLLREEV